MKKKEVVKNIAVSYDQWRTMRQMMLDERLKSASDVIEKLLLNYKKK